MTPVHRVLLAGASGLVGSEVRRQLLAWPEGPAVVSLLRRPLPKSSDTPRDLTWVADLSVAGRDGDLTRELRAVAGDIDACICCLGTTIRQAGSREGFLAVDRDLVLRVGVIARTLGARQMVLVSSVGASAQSNNFYLRVKGETERALADLDFQRLDLLRPGLLLGERAETRHAEQWGQRLAPVTNALMRGPLRRYRAIAATDVAAAAVALLRQDEGGRHVHENAGLLALAGA
ncbi:NAD-dependent epimerase/dehydratase family protein [Arenimonas alkanexedens]